MPNQMSFNVALTGLLSVAMLVLSIVELCKPTRSAKMLSLTWMSFGVGFGCLSAALYLTGMTWHLPNAQKPWAAMNGLGGLATLFMVIALIRLKRVVAAKDLEESELEAEKMSKPFPSEGVWPPPPAGP